MNSFRQNKGYGRLWAATLLVALLFVADVLSGGIIRNEVRSAGIAVSRWGGVLSQGAFGSGFFSSRASLAAQNRSLSEQLTQYQERAAAYTMLQEENRQLRDIVQLAQSASGFTAPIVSSLRSSPYGTFLIGAGDADGVVSGNIVLTSSGFVLGVVSDIATRTALVSEVLAPGSSVDALVNGSAIVVEGRGGGNGRASIPRGLDIEIGTPVVVPAYGGRALGIVGEIATSSSSATQDIFLRLPVNRAGIQFVYVVPSR